MAVNSKDIETLWKQYSEEGVEKGISVVQFFESNGVLYHTFEKWYIWRSLVRNVFNARLLDGYGTRTVSKPVKGSSPSRRDSLDVQ